jgi:hypothetical protein
MSYATIQNKDLTNTVRGDVPAKGTVRSSSVVRKLKTDIYGFKAYSGDGETLCEVGIQWLPGKTEQQAFASSKKFVLGYYTPRL